MPFSTFKLSSLSFLTSGFPKNHDSRVLGIQPFT